MRSWLRRLSPLIRLPYLPLWVAPLALFLPLLLGGQALFWGTPYLQFVPWRMAAVEMLLKGQLPLWTPGLGMGAPLLANYQTALFYPPNWLLLALGAIGGAASGAAWTAYAQTVVVVFHLVLAGAGTARLAHRLGANPLGQAIAGLAFGISGYLVARAGFLSINAAVAWLPWAVLAARQLAGRRLAAPPEDGAKPIKGWLARVLPLGVILALQLLAGHAQTSAYTLLFIMVWVGWESYLFDRWRGMLSGLAGLFIAVALAVGLAAVQILPTAEYLSQSQRSAAVDYSLAVNYSFFPLRFLTLLVPNLLGNPAQGNYLPQADNFWEDDVYIGLLPVLLALATAFTAAYAAAKGIIPRLFKKRKPAQSRDSHLLSRNEILLILFLIALIVVSFVLALGRYTPIFPFLYRYIPTFNLFQAPTRFSLWAEFGLALLAGVGASHWKPAEGNARKWVNLGIAAAISAILAAIGVGVALRNVPTVLVLAVVTSGLVGVAAGILARKVPALPEKAGLWHWMVVILVGGDLLWAGWGLNPGTNLDLYRPPQNLTAVQQILGTHRLYLPADQEEQLKFQRYFTFKSFIPPGGWQGLREAYLPDANLLDGVASVNNFDPLLPGRYVRWMAMLDQAGSRTRDALLPEMDVVAIELVAENSASGVQFSAVSGANRVTWRPCAVSAGDEEKAWKLVTDPARIDRLLGNQPVPAIIEAQPGVSLAGDCAASPVLNAILERETPTQLQYSVSNQAGGWLILSDLWYPGWQVSLDNQSAPLYRADYLFRGVWVPAGSHRIIFTYRPTSFYAGAVISLVFLCGVIIFYFRQKKVKHGS